VEADPTRSLEIVIGLGVDVAVDGVFDVVGEPSRVHGRKLGGPPRCEGCAVRVRTKARVQVVLSDPTF